jgi:hypothetical protein
LNINKVKYIKKEKLITKKDVSKFKNNKVLIVSFKKEKEILNIK